MTSIAQKTVFVGIDVHRKSYSVCCVSDSSVVKKCRMPANGQLLIGFLKKHFSEHVISTVYEAGFSGFELHRAIEAASLRSCVVHAASVEVSHRDRVKTDKRDALKLATQLAAGRLRGIRIPSREEEQRRQLTRTRQQLMQHRTAIKNQIRSKLHIFGLLDPNDRRELSLMMVEQVLSRTEIAQLRIAIQSLLGVWLALNEQLKKLQAALREQAKTDPLEKVYRSLPGFGPLASRVCANELGNMLHFSNCKKLYSFTGLTPGEQSSGEKVWRGAITKQGSARLRHVLVQAAWMAIRRDAGLRADFERIARNANKLKAIVAIARKLIGRARALFRDHEMYDTKGVVSLVTA